MQRKPVGLFFLMLALIILYPAVHSKLSALSAADPVQNAMIILVPMFLWTFIAGLGGFIGYEVLKH
jgi:hypothetical protein